MDKSRDSANEEYSREKNRWENVLLDLYKIVIWEKPLVSAYSIVCVNTVFWSVVYLDLKLYGIIFAALLGLTLKQLWTNQISRSALKKNEFNDRPIERKNLDGDSKISNAGSLRTSSDFSLILEEIRTFSRNVYEGAKNFRQTEPTSFCLAGCFCFAMLGFVGNFLSGILTFYILLMVLMIVPGAAIHFLMPRINGKLSNLFHSSHEGKIDHKIKEEAELFLPEMNQEALEVLNMAAEFQNSEKLEDDDFNDPLLECISARTNETTESLNSKLSFYPDSSQMPSPEHSMDFLELDLTVGGNNQKLDFDNEEINFLSKHFDGNSSDEEEFANGLKLTCENNDKGNLDDTNIEKQNLNPGALITIGQKLLKTIIQSANANKNDGESSSDTDSFEMVSEKDI